MQFMETVKTNLPKLLSAIKDNNEQIRKLREQLPAAKDAMKFEMPVECVADSVKFDEGFKTGREIGFREGVESVKPVEWNEEDKEALEMAIISLEDMFNIDSPLDTYGGYNMPFNEAAKRLKSLRPQPKRSWTISDAKPGDILTTDTVTFIFKSIDEDGCVSMYCSYSVSTTGKDIDFSDTAYVNSEYVHPASIEQREEFLSKLWKFISRPH